VTGPKEVPHAVLIRSIHPLEGIDVMQRRRNKIFNKDTAVSDFTTGHFTTGPGRVTQALGIDLSLYGEPLSSQKIWIEDRGYTVKHVRKLPRVGIDYAKEWAKKPWRFLMGGLQEILF
jgi:DNA-3-methyladenine glycosylase